jgi:hypothetical protein
VTARAAVLEAASSQASPVGAQTPLSRGSQVLGPSFAPSWQLWSESVTGRHSVMPSCRSVLSGNNKGIASSIARVRERSKRVSGRKVWGWGVVISYLY